MIRVKEETEKADLKLNIQEIKIMASGTIISWQTDRKKIETVKHEKTVFFPWAPKFTADYNCSHEIKNCLLLGRKAMTNLDSILKSRDIKGPYSRPCQQRSI